MPQVSAAIWVHVLMLIQCCLSYIRMRMITKKTKDLVPMPSQETLKGMITVIIPVQNDEIVISKTIRGVCENANDPENLRIVVSDIGCTDKTLDMVERLGSSGEFKTKIVTGRRQAVEAAPTNAADDGLLLFLHADTVPPPKFDVQLRAEFAKPGVLMTAFQFEMDRAVLVQGLQLPPGAGCMELAVNLRSRWFNAPLGDQALATTKKNLEMIDGFPEVPNVAEYAMVKRFRKLSAEGAGSIVTLEDKALCSPLKWLNRPVWFVRTVDESSKLKYNIRGAPPAPDKAAQSL